MKTIKTWLAMIAVLLFSITANAHDFEVDGIYYNITSDSTVKVTYRGESYYSYSNEYYGNVVIPSEVTYFGKEYRVTSIRDYAFYECSRLTSVTIGNSVTSIGEEVFYGCKGLTSVTIPNSVTSIGKGAFYGCNSLKKVFNFSTLNITKGSSGYGYVGYYAGVVVNNPELIDNYVFAQNGNTYALYGYMGTDTKLQLPENYRGENYIIGDCAFYECSGLTSITIPNGVTRIGEEVFYGCKGLTSVTIPNSVTSIGDYAFYGCSGLTSITIPNSVTSIGKSAFCGCSGLTSATIPNSVTSIGKGAFYKCSGLTSVTIGNSVRNIEDDAFYGCNSLKKVFNFSTLNITKGSSGYGYVGYYAGVVVNNPELIDNYVFAQNGNTYALYGYMGTDTKLQLPENYRGENYIIGDYAFYRCKGLTSVTIPNGVTSIGESVFYGCSNLKNLTIGAGVLSIGDYQTKPTKVIWLTNTPPSGYEYLAGSINYVANENYSKLTNKHVYKHLSSYFEVDGIVYVPVNPSERTCDAITCGYDSTITSVNIGETVSYKGIAMNVLNVMPYTAHGQASVKTVNLGSKGDIGEKAFYGCSGITEATIANEGNIGTSAFEGAMTSTNSTLNLSNKGDIGEKAFYGCKGITEATIANEGNIGTSAFEGAMTSQDAKLKVTIPGTVGVRAFFGCSALVNAELNIMGGEETEDSTAPLTFEDWTSTNTAHASNSSNTYTFTVQTEATLSFDWWVSSESGYDKLIVTLDGTTILEKSGNSYNGTFTKTIGSGSHTLVVKYTKDGYTSGGQDKAKVSNINVVGGTSMTSASIGNDAFYGCNNLSDITLGDGIKSIGNYAFYGCSKLTEVTIPNKTTSLGEYCFSGNTLLVNIELGNGLKNIGQYCFSGCNMSEISIPASMTNIGNYAFENCSSLADVVIEDRNTELTLGSNGSSPLFASCPLDSVYIGGKIKYSVSSSSGYSPFYRNTSLRTIVIDGNEEEIYDNEFYGCTNLKNVTMGDGVKKIGKWAFSGCSNLDYFSFGSGMQSIGDEAFSDCINLTKLISYAEVPPTCGTMALDDINKWVCVLQVPEKCLSAYQAADQWKEFFFIEDVLTGINEVEKDSIDYVKGDVYSLNGTLLKRNVNINQLNSILPAGLYIVNGKKVVVK